MVAVSRGKSKNFQTYRENNYSSDDSSSVSYLSPLVGSDEDSDSDFDDTGKSANTHVFSNVDINKIDPNKENVATTKNDQISSKKSFKTTQGRKKLPSSRLRRRSSNRFLSLSKRFVTSENESNNDNGESNLDSTEATIRNNNELGEMYRQAIRMNTENRINAGNSWSFGLIENIDKFLCDDDEVDENIKNDQIGKSLSKLPSIDSAKHNEINNMNQELDSKRINFTKASCTIDASVKIYSYRVDDVHLTSYKVLANLNRTGKGGNNDNDISENQSKPSEIGQRKQSERRNVASTIETNVNNLNMVKLDSALDIDPLFHKMTKAFDEGGAKGLLLVNLGVASDSCQIVFDSNDQSTKKNTEGIHEKNINTDLTMINEEDRSGDDESKQIEESNTIVENCANMDLVDGTEMNATNLADDEEKNEFENAETALVPMTNAEDDKDEFENVETIVSPLDNITENNENSIDITSLTSKFKNLLNGTSVAAVPFMPQMKEIREEYAQLEAEGFVTSSDTSPKSKRYTISAREEREAEEVIHREALERTRMTEAQTSFAVSAVTDQSEFISENFEGDMDDGFDDNFMNQTMEIQPSFYNDNDVTFGDNFDLNTSKALAPFNENSLTTRILDVICDSDAINSGGRYEFFDAKALKRMTAGNYWAGSSHWKKSETLFRKKNKQEEEKSNGIDKNKQVKSSKATFVDLLNGEHAKTLIDKLCERPKKKKGKKDAQQLSQAKLAKQSKEDYVLPHDAEIHVDKLFRLFLRPKLTVVLEKAAEDDNIEKRVCFQDNHNGSGYDDDFDNGYDAGFDISNNKGEIHEHDDLVIQDLEGVRRVEKVAVGYATVAKKVDVKRLKSDMWSELKVINLIEDEDEVKEENVKSIQDSPQSIKKESEEKSDLENMTNNKVSFQEVVNKLDSSQRQEDVSIAFYFICLLHLANEKSLALDANGFDLNDFMIMKDNGDKMIYPDMILSEKSISVEAQTNLNHREKRATKTISYKADSDDEMNMNDDEKSDIEHSDSL